MLHASNFKEEQNLLQVILQMSREMLKIIRAVHTKQFPAKIVINDLEFNFNRDLLE